MALFNISSTIYKIMLMVLSAITAVLGFICWAIVNQCRDPTNPGFNKTSRTFAIITAFVSLAVFLGIAGLFIYGFTPMGRARALSAAVADLDTEM
jgi:hypothetical protein